MSGPIDTGRVESIKNSTRKPFRILSLDGGGVRAIIQTTLLKRLQKEFPNLLSEVDMFAGVSAGSIVASAMCNGLTPEQTCEMWMNTAPKIFVESYLRRIKSLDNAFGAPYDPLVLKDDLQATIGTKTLGQLNKKILIPSFNLDPPTDKQPNHRWLPECFHNFEGSKFMDLPLIEAVLRSAAAPTYFPIRDGYVDGGTFANNPALLAITTAMNNGIKLEDIVVLSISTGNNPRCIKKATLGDGNWGLVEWAPHLIDLLLDSSTEATDYSCNCILREQYHRVDPILSEPIDLADATKLKELTDIAEKVDLSNIQSWIIKYWKASPTLEVGEAPLPAPPAVATTNRGYCNVM